MVRMVLGLALCGACGDVKDLEPDAPRPSDGPPVDVAPADSSGPRCDPNKPFGAPVAIPELASSANDYHASLSPDELQIMFASDRMGGTGMIDIFLSTRTSTSATFSAPALLAGVNTSGNDSRPITTADGLTLYAEVTRGAGWHLASATRASTSVGFSALSDVSSLNSGTSEVAPFVLPDHSAVYFVSSRNGASELYRAARVDGAFMTPQLVEGTDLVGNGAKDYPALTPDELTMYFTSNRAGGSGGNDIWVMSRSSVVTAFGAPVNLGPTINTAETDSPSWVSADNCVLYLSRFGGTNYDLFVATKPL
ncbi:MAG: hypothetical protein SFX73_01880 [Kofleriaceae bacterium]|nr:hypothetical protein [Kofleriaceae bacterium]